MEPRLIATRLRSGGIRYWPAGGTASDLFGDRFPDPGRLMAMADLAARGRIRFWHPWHMEQTHRTETLVHPGEWQCARNGDPEWLDSLARFTHLFDLAAAFALSGRRRYLRALSRQLDSFSSARGGGHPHWRDPLNAALRVVNLIKAFDLLRDLAVDDGTCSIMVGEILTDCRFLHASLGERSGNWEVAISTALLIAAHYLSGVLDTRECTRSAGERLAWVLDRDIRPDGVQIEEVPLYHGEVMLFLFDYLTILRSNGLTVETSLVAVLQRMRAAIEGLADPQGLIPPIGDSDRFPVAYLSGIADRLLPGDGHRGPPRPATDRPARMQVFADTGWVVVNWERAGAGGGYLLFDCSGKPVPDNAWHSHADDLNFIYHTTDGPLITDPGRFTYARQFRPCLPLSNVPCGEWGWRKRLNALLRPRFRELNARDWRAYFRSTLAHNTVSCDREDQPGYTRHREPGRRVRLRRSELRGRRLILEAELDTGAGSSKSPLPPAPLPAGYQQRRGLYGWLPEILVIVDRLQADRPRDWTNSLHFPPVAALTRGRCGTRVRVADNDFLVAMINDHREAADSQLQDDWVSEVYNRKQPAKSCRSRVEACASVAFISVILDNPGKPELSITLDRRPGGDLEKVRVDYATAQGPASLAVTFGREGEETRVERTPPAT